MKVCVEIFDWGLPRREKGKVDILFLCVTDSSYMFTSFFYGGTVTLLYILLVINIKFSSRHKLEDISVESPVKQATIAWPISASLWKVLSNNIQVLFSCANSFPNPQVYHSRICIALFDCKLCLESCLGNKLYPNQPSLLRSSMGIIWWWSEGVYVMLLIEHGRWITECVGVRWLQGIMDHFLDYWITGSFLYYLRDVQNRC